MTHEGFEVGYDASGAVEVTRSEGPADLAEPTNAALPQDGMGCHAGASEMKAAARAAGKSDILDQYAKDYPQGPHDQPQSMCPAFGSLRVGLRMRRVATILRDRKSTRLNSSHLDLSRMPSSA